MKIMNRELSLQLVNQVVERLEEISEHTVFVFYNDLYKTKKGETRRLKIGFNDNGVQWINKTESSIWNDKLKKSFPGIDIVLEGVNKLKAIGSKEEASFLREEFVKYGEGTFDEYDYRFNNEDYYFTVKIRY